MQEALIDTPFGPLAIRVTRTGGRPEIEAEYVTPAAGQAIATLAVWRRRNMAENIPGDG